MADQTILHYQILQKLGAGGMGEVYKALDTRLNRFVAVKALSRESSGDPERRRRFLQEAQAASSLNHPNIVTIYDIFPLDGREFMVMEYVSGKTLADLIPAAGMDIGTVLQSAVQIASALEAAHAAGIVHRDLKPGNVMISDAGLVKILDFGLAKLGGLSAAVSLNDETQTLATAPLTVEGSILGTVSYMSPEQAQGKPVDARSDIFSFGLLLYEMVTGRKAFFADSAISTLSAILRDEPKPVTEIVPGAPAELVNVIHKAIRKEPGERWQSMAEPQPKLAALKLKLDSGVLFTQAPPLTKPARRRGRRVIGLLAPTLLAAFIAGRSWLDHQNSRAPRTESTSSTPVSAPASQPAPPLATIPTAPETVLNNDTVIAMAKAKVPATVIIGQVRSSKTSFDLSAEAVIRLSQNGVPVQVIEAMRNPAVPPAMAPSAPAIPPPVPPAPADSAPPESAVVQPGVRVTGGVPFEIALLEDVPADPQPGIPLRFETVKDVRSSGAVVIAKGALVTGEIVAGTRKKFLGRSSRPSYRLFDVAAVDGSKLKVRATPGRNPEKKDRPLDALDHLRPKDLAATAGSRFLAYFDGDQIVKPQR
jgi:serine/threonine-protein kinase